MFVIVSALQLRAVLVNHRTCFRRLKCGGGDTASVRMRSQRTEPRLSGQSRTLRPVASAAV